MAFVYEQMVHFRDTDAAGVVYFANILALCHNAYEASLMASGLDIKAFFSNPQLAVPIAHASIDFWRPLHCGDRLQIAVIPCQLAESEFEIGYELAIPGSQDRPESIRCGKAHTRHICIHPERRQRVPILPELAQWIEQWCSEFAQ